MSFIRGFAFVVLTFGVSVMSADADPVSLSFDFVASDIFGPDPVPVGPVTGSVSVNFDNAASLTDITSGISISNLSMGLGSAAAFTYDAPTDTLHVGGINIGATGFQIGTDDFVLRVSGASFPLLGGFPLFGSFVFTQAGANAGWAAGTGTLTPSAVPEPASLTLLGLGLGLVGVRRWRQRRST